MNKKMIIGLMIIICVVGYLFWSGMKESTAYFLTVGEFFEQKDQLVNQGIRINGDIVENSINWDAKNLMLTFQLTDGENALPVKHTGIAPDTFKEGVPVVIEGKFDGSVFQATQIMTKCPSKYEAKKES